MNKVMNFTKILLLTAFALVLGACSNDDLNDLEQEKQSASTLHTCKMDFRGSVVGFDQKKSSVAKRATSSSWSDGDKIFITFYNGSTIVPGEAIYSSSSGWSVSYDGNLAAGTSLKCETRYFVNATSSTRYLVTLNANTEIYEDLNATYTYDNGTLTVQANLIPKTGRIRFTGTSGAKINTTGITTYATYAPGNNIFTTSKALVTSTVAVSGSTPYIYGYFSDSERSISVIGSDFAFTRTCTSDMLKTGDSGYMAIPSESAHDNWRIGVFVKAGDNELRMIPVVGLSSGFFLIAETETTGGFYNSVNGTSSTSALPVSNISYSTISSFIVKLNNDTKLNFDLPTKEQWQFAAKGGNKSQGYTYSGSNIPEDVAWYSANASTKQNVKTKNPNELGIYDMSGNVGEYVATKTGSYYYVLGGGYNSSLSEIAVAYSNNSEYGSYLYIGFRLILTCP